MPPQSSGSAGGGSGGCQEHSEIHTLWLYRGLHLQQGHAGHERRISSNKAHNTHGWQVLALRSMSHSLLDERQGWEEGALTDDKACEATGWVVRTLLLSLLEAGWQGEGLGILGE